MIIKDIYIYYKRTLDTYIVDYQCFNYTLYKTIMQVFFPLKQHIIELTHPKSLGWRFLKIVFFMILIRFRYDLLLWFVYGLVLLLWFWYGFSYDFDMISVMILDVGQTCDLKPTHRNHIQNIPKSYQNHIKIVSKPYQNRIKIVSKSYQNHKNLRQIDQEPVPVLFLFLFLKPTHWNHIKIISKSYQNRIKTISKSYQNHKNHWKLDQKHVPVLFLFFSKPTHWKPYQNHIKIVSKSYQNHIKIIPKP